MLLASDTIIVYSLGCVKLPMTTKAAAFHVAPNMSYVSSDT